MQGTFRAKLFALGAVAALAVVILAITGSLVERSVDRHLETIRAQYIPKIGLADQLSASFERVSRGLQDAANAADAGFLDEAHKREATLLDQVTAARGAIDPARVPAVRAAIEDYYATAEATTRKAIRGTTGEGFVDEMTAMQAKQAAVAKLLDEVASFDQRGLTDAFAAASDAQEAGANIRLAISLACIASVLALSLWIARGMYRGLGVLTEGLQRFGEGDLATPIPATRRDELGTVAKNANQMADRLRRLGEDRDRGVWIKAAQVGLDDSLRGELATEDVATRALDYLARYVGAPVGVIYFAGPDDVLRPLASHGLTAARRAALPSFAFGDGLVGEAARATEPRVIRGAESHLVHLAISSGTGDSAPSLLVFVPIILADKVRGVIELGATAWDVRETELALSVRETIGIAIDVARNRAAMRDLLAETQRQASELLAARQGLEEQARELARASTYKSQFLANMSHELRTPLNAILGFSELLHDGAVPPEQHKEFLADVIASGRHLLQLINDILDLSKIEAGKLEFHADLVDVRGAVDEVLATLKTVAIAARVRVEARVVDGLGDIYLDRVRLKQVLYNYISNAIKFTPEGGRVTIAVTADGPARLKLAVTDTGIGIAPADLPRLFGEFQQLVAGDGKQRGGTGLGLALTKRLVEVQGGVVGVASVVGEGSTFHAVLPRDARGARETKSETLDAGKRDKVVAGPSVLVVEDDPRDRAEIVAALEAGGYVTTIAASGAQALDYLRRQTFDAITLDLVLPDMSGMDVLKRLREGGVHRDVPVIVLTIVAEQGAVSGFAVDDILQKPLDPEQLLGALRRAGVGARGTVMIVDDDPSALKLMASTLGALGYETRCERDAEVALRALAEVAPSAIVLDLLMPGLSGFEFLDRLRRGATQGDRRIPVIVWTSKDLTIGETATLRASASAVVQKGAHQGPSVVEELGSLLPRRSLPDQRSGDPAR